jgi:hypothetical protein
MIMHHRQIRVLNRLQTGIRVRILKAVKVLHQSDDGVTRLGQGILLYMNISTGSPRPLFAGATGKVEGIW